MWKTRRAAGMPVALAVLVAIGAGCGGGAYDVPADARPAAASPEGEPGRDFDDDIHVAAARAGVGAVIWSPHANVPGCHINLGPTGARGWLDGAYVRVAYVASGSPADGRLFPGDKILGVGGTRFTDESDARMEIGRAIGDAEGRRRGNLTFRVLRYWRERSVMIKLPATGSYSATWPYDCPKSRRILAELCRYLERDQLPGGRFVSDGNLANPMAGLVFLATGEVRHLERARRAAYWLMDQDLVNQELRSWILGYGGVLLAEYYLRTGDRNVIEPMKTITKKLASGQMDCGSWGHNCPGGAYGAMNQAGIVCVMALVLAQECGVGVDRAVLKKAVAFFDRYVGRGSIPYGDHIPQNSPTSNGKNASAAVMYSLIAKVEDGRSDAVEFFSELTARSYRHRESGHTGPLFNIIWGPLGAIHAGREKFRTFMDYQKWYYDLCRTWEGALTISPYAEALTRFDNCPYVWWGGAFTSGIGLTYALPLKKLRILGAPGSVFGARLDRSMDELKKALREYHRRRWIDFNEAIARCKEAYKKGGTAARWTAQLAAAADEQQRSVGLTLEEIETHLAESDHYRANEQYKALGRYLGRNYYKLEPLKERLEAKQAKWLIGEGELYYKALAGLKEAAFKSWVPRYGHAAKAVLDEMRLPGPSPIWRDLVALPGKASGGDVPVWKVLVTGGDEADAAPAGWQSVDFDDSGWKTLKGKPGRSGGKGAGEAGHLVLLRTTFELDAPAFRRLRALVSSDRYARSDVYLNGVLVARVVLGQKRTAAKIELQPRSVTLLKDGANCLAVSCSVSGARPPNVGVGIQASED